MQKNNLEKFNIHHNKNSQQSGNVPQYNKDHIRLAHS